jgi:hypothetical protein
MGVRGERLSARYEEDSSGGEKGQCRGAEAGF